jgi:hypothetical protein
VWLPVRTGGFVETDLVTLPSRLLTLVDEYKSLRASVHPSSQVPKDKISDQQTAQRPHRAKKKPAGHLRSLSSGCINSITPLPNMLILCILICTLNTGSRCTKSSSKRFLFLPTGFVVVVVVDVVVVPCPCPCPFPLGTLPEPGVRSCEGNPERVDVYGEEAEEGVEPEAV